MTQTHVKNPHVERRPSLCTTEPSILNQEHHICGASTGPFWRELVPCADRVRWYSSFSCILLWISSRSVIQYERKKIQTYATNRFMNGLGRFSRNIGGDLESSISCLKREYRTLSKTLISSYWLASLTKADESMTIMASVNW